MIMKSIERKLLTSLLSNVPTHNLSDAVTMMWKQGLINRTALERLYIRNEVQRRVRNGESKVRAIEQLSNEIACSYEKVRSAVYNK